MYSMLYDVLIVQYCTIISEMNTVSTTNFNYEFYNIKLVEANKI